MESFIPFALMKKACGHCLYHKVQFLTIFCTFDKKLSNSQKLYTIETIPMHGMVPKDLQVMNYTLVWVVFGPCNTRYDYTGPVPCKRRLWKPVKQNRIHFCDMLNLIKIVLLGINELVYNVSIFECTLGFLHDCLKY